MSTTIEAQLAQATEMLAGQAKFLDGLKQVLNHQVLMNVDQLEVIVRETEGIPQESRVRLLDIIKYFVKEPIRRQNGRLIANIEAINAVHQKIKRAGELAQPAKE